MSGDGRLSCEEHSKYPWIVGDIAPDFELVDAWALPACGTRDDFPDLVAIFADLAPGDEDRPTASRLLFAVRTWLGDRLGWDDDPNVLPIPGCLEASLRDRLPPHVEPETGETAGRLPFRPIYRTDDEWALELSNSTVHAVLHLGWVPRSDGSHHGQLGVYVKHRGRLGRPYMAAIAPFRHRIVYPALLKRIERDWRDRPSKRAVVAVIHSNGRFLWIRRGPGVVKPGYWMPPSGTIEPGESPPEALMREMREELGIEVLPLRRVWRCPTEDATHMLDWWLAEIVSGEAVRASDEVAELRWVDADEIHELSPTFDSHLEFIDAIWPTLDASSPGDGTIAAC